VGQGDRMAFWVRVDEGESQSDHDVTISAPDLARLGRRGESPENFVRRAFEFLLTREPKESILARFDVRVIGRYFPEFEREISAED